MADIFLSYKREDREKVRPLVGALQAQGWSVWWDTRIGAGETWDQVIEAELAAAQCVIVVWSTLSVTSRWVRSEAHEGLERGCLIPVIIESVKAPIAFKLIQGADLTHWRGVASDPALADVLAGVRRIVGKLNQDDGAARKPSVNRSSPQVSAIDRKNAAAYASTGEDYLRKKDYDSAITEFTRAIEVDPGRANFHDGRGTAYLGKKDYGRAVANFNKAIEIDPKRAFFLTNRGSAYLDMNDYERAIADFTKAIEIDPTRPYSHVNRGRAYFGMNDYDRAVANFSKAVEIDPKYDWAFFQRGEVYFQRKDYDLAIADYARAIEIKPHERYFYYLRGRTFKERGLKGDRGRAAADFRKALEIDPTYSLAKDGLKSVGEVA